MAIEVNPNYPSDLDSSIPTNGDFKAEGDDNFRNLKRVLKTTLPNINGAITATQTELNYSVGVTSGIQSQINAAVTSITTATGATLWVSGTTYALGAFVYSPINARNYRKITASSLSSTDPSLDSTNWTDPATMSGTASGTVNLLTGANIASASTVNLDTATGNRVHITGTTTITAVTLTRGPRTVIFDGALTLTHNATANNLPGAANITTVAGDRAIYESDGTTVYCIGYFRKDGTPVVSNAGAPLTVVTASAASVALLNTNITSTYDVYDLVIEGVTSVDGANVQLRYELAGSVISTSTYQYNAVLNGTNNAANSGAPAAQIVLMSCGNSASNGFNVTVRIYRPTASGLTRQITWLGASTRTETQSATGSAMNQGTGALTGIQVFPSSGTITCTMRLYGVPNA